MRSACRNTTTLDNAVLRSDMNITFTAEITINQAELDAARSLAQAVQNRIGSSGAVVVSVATHE
jgi:hypothetical protein